MEKKFSGSKAAVFLKKNGYYIIMAVCIVAIITLVGVAAFAQSPKIDDPGTNLPVEKPDDSGNAGNKPKPSPIVFTSPTKDGSVGMSYSMDALVFHKSLDNWQVHRGLDFVTVAREDVFSIADGVVEDVSFNNLDGQIVTIKHAEGYTSVYKSIADATVTKGKTVTKGMVIGKTSDGAMNEVLEGSHVHIEVMKNGTLIDPASVIPVTEK